MTVPSAVNKAQFPGNGGNTVFTCNFLLPQAQEVLVITTAPDGTQTPILPGPAAGQYQLSGVGVAQGFTVTYQQSGGPLPTGWLLTVLRQLPLIQTTSFVNQSSLFEQVVEAAFDYVTMLIQQFVELVSRTPTLPPGTLATFNQNLPTPVANGAIGFNSAANGFAVILQAGTIGVPVPVNQGGTGATTAAQALINLGAASGPWTGAPAATFVNATTFTMVGNQTAALEVGRRMKFVVTAGTVYGVITSLDYNITTPGLTTVLVNMTLGALDAGLNTGTAAYDTLDAVSSAAPLFATNAKGIAVASAATTNIWVLGGDLAHITGVAAINSLGTALVVGAEMTTVTDAACSFVNGASLICLTGANITAAAGDVQKWRAETATVARMVGYERANGKQLLVGPLQINVVTATGTHTTPAGCTRANIRRLIGAGASGGGSSTAAANGGCGGGGEVREGWVTTTPAATVTVTLNAGGAAIALNTNASGNNGGTSVWTDGSTTVTANGGIGGVSGNSGGAGGRGGNGGAGGDIGIPGLDGLPGATADAAKVINASAGFSTPVANSGAGGAGGASGGASIAGAKGICYVEYWP